MPQVIIEHDVPLNNATCDRLVEALSKLCARLFFADDWQQEPAEFGFKFESIERPSRSTHNVTVRITLDSFDNNVSARGDHAALIRNAVLIVLHDAYPDMWCTVGVSLTYAEVAWSSGTYDDVP